MPERAILHVDMDAFFASVEQLDDPKLRGKPVLVGHDGARGVVAAASYEARRFGCHSALPMAIAKRRCPHAIIVHPRGKRYHELSRIVFGILDEITPLVEPLSIDEAFLDVTGSERLHGSPVAIAGRIKQQVETRTGLQASVGVAPNKFLAKLASDLDKPDGLTVVTRADVGGRIAALPIKKMWGVGPATETKLAALGIHVFADLQRLTEEQAVGRLGAGGAHWWRLARGEDERPVAPDGVARSISSEQTFGVDVADVEHVRHVLLGQTEHVAARLRRRELAARTVALKIRFGDFETISRSQTLRRPSSMTGTLWSAAGDLFDRWSAQGFRPVRLIGVALSNLGPAGGGQLELFVDEAEQRSHRIDAVSDSIQERFGHASIRRGIPYTET